MTCEEIQIAIDEKIALLPVQQAAIDISEAAKDIALAAYDLTVIQLNESIATREVTLTEILALTEQYENQDCHTGTGSGTGSGS